MLFKLTRKSLPPSVYRFIQTSPLGRAKKWETLETYESIFNRYQNLQIGELHGKAVMEIGCGNQFYTALFFLSQGARKIVLIEPKFNIEENRSQLTRTIQEFNEKRKTTFEIDDVLSCIEAYNDISELPQNYNGGIDIGLSNFVLEHIHHLDSFYSELSRVLSKDGISYNIVDLSDHTYHVFSKYPLLQQLNRNCALAHLKYSDRLFNFINDSKCYVNRVLLPEHCRLAEENNLTATVCFREPYKKVSIHRDLLKRTGVSSDCSDLYISLFHLQLTRK